MTLQDTIMVCLLVVSVIGVFKALLSVRKLL